MKAYAKVNLSLRVRPAGADGYHPLLSIVQSIDLHDDVSLETADEDHVEVHDADIEADDNLGWKAVRAVRDVATDQSPLRLSIRKRIPVAAGLGGGSADGAASLVSAAAVLGVNQAAVFEIAPRLGADVLFCLTGGSMLMEGVGEVLSARQAPDDFAIALVVPPFELSTPGVYRRWDELDGPSGLEIGSRHLPASLRDDAPLVNDLTPAALSLQPSLGDWISDVASAWGQPVAMSGSGPSLFGLFPSQDEAVDAAGAIEGARAAVGVVPVDRGWDGEPGGRLPAPPWGVV